MAGKKLQFGLMLGFLKESLAQIPEHRRGQNGRYEISDAGLGAFAVFFTQSPSFLAYQQDMQRRQGRNNVHSMFGVQNIPSDGQIRNLLDPVDPSLLHAPFWQIYTSLQQGGYLEDYWGATGTRLVSLDGTQFFSSQKVHCESCHVAMRDEREYYSHQVLLAMVSAPGKEHVICLPPEFMVPQDGHEKQDCEQQAIKRWVQQHSQQFDPWSVTILTDDLHCHQPVCQLLLEHQMHFILTCKPDSHVTLYEELQLLEGLEGAISTETVRHWNGRHHEQWVYRWAEQVPLRDGADALWVNWCEWTVINEETGEQLYHCAWATDHSLDQTSVMAVAQDGRTRWKVENEGINVLKRRGYNFEHNYGHGDCKLSMVLLSLLLLAFLLHTALDLSCLMYRAVRDELHTRRKFFDDVRALTTYLYWDSFEHMLAFMCQGLELALPSD